MVAAGQQGPRARGRRCRRPASAASPTTYMAALADAEAANPLRGAPANAERYNFETFECSWPAPHVLNIAMNRPKRRNAQNGRLWE